ncbi:Ras guanine nucleotide exchange factor [Planoprotostelium fungivorum]|uniref:Ras guanine nucleotide exchange factor n=1 Tax=Planoprotostelium fungivorum TaxID=1890364 RepID=A0A2P6NRP8_9EUKA|nr:Ras guanine nucleotide exchange factor [Planoprotostelium fungivorum]
MHKHVLDKQNRSNSSPDAAGFQRTAKRAVYDFPPRTRFVNDVSPNYIRRNDSEGVESPIPTSGRKLRRSSSDRTLNSWEKPEDFIRHSTSVLFPSSSKKLKSPTLGRALVTITSSQDLKKQKIIRTDTLAHDLNLLRAAKSEELSSIYLGIPQDILSKAQEEEVTYDENGKITCCTIEFALSQMVHPDYLKKDPEWVNILCLTHRFFMPTDAFLRSFLQQAEQTEHSTQAIRNMSMWLDVAPTDFRFGHSADSAEMNEAAKKVKELSVGQEDIKEVLVEQIKATCSRNMEHYYDYTGKSPLIKEPSATKQLPRRRAISLELVGLSGTKFTLFDVSSGVLAEQLTLREHKLFCSIKLNDITHYDADKGTSRAVQAYVSHFNKISFWVVTEIVSATTEKIRVTVLTRFIKLANKCYDMDNYNTAVEIYCGLVHGTVSRLAKTWKKIPRKYKRIFATLSEVFQPEGNHKNFRQILKAKNLADSTQPINPYFALHLRDLALVEMHNKDKIGERINFHKMRVVAPIFAAMQRYQRVPYVYEHNAEMSMRLESISPIMDEIELRRRSALCEQQLSRSLTDL